MRRLLSASLLILALGVAGCSGDNDAPTASGPSTMVPVTITLPTVAPTLSPPPLDPRLRDLGSGELALNVAAGARQVINPLEIASAAGITPPACADYVFLFSWQVEEPKGGALAFETSRMGGTTEVAKGSADVASVGGCSRLEVVNSGSSAAKGRLRYFVASSRP